MTLRLRLAVMVAALVAVAIAAASWVGYVSARDEARAEVDTFLRQRGIAGLGIEIAGRGPRGAGPGGGPFQPRDDVVAQVVLRDGSVIAVDAEDPRLPVSETELSVAAGIRHEVLRDVVVEGVHYRMITRPFLRDASIQIARELTETDRFLAGLRLRLLAIGGAGVALAALAGWLIARRISRPIEGVASAAERVAATQDLDTPIPVEGDDEVARLAAAFNEMLQALGHARTQQRRLVADASHELRTPLTSLRTNIELLARGGIEAEAERQEIMDDALAELGELTALVSELVDLATVGADEEPTVRLRLGELASEIAGQAQRRSGLEVTVMSDASEVEGRPTALRRALANLVDNAVKWSPPGGEITITVSGGEVRVRDRGPGIADEDISRIFDRFYRAPSARTAPGSGLGLAIVARVADWHGGTVFAENADEGGAVVGMRLPVARQTETS